MKRVLTALITTACLCLTAAALADGVNAWVDGQDSDRVHLRAGASTGDASMGLYFTGAPLILTGDAGSGWSAVTVGVNSGYMKTEYLSASPVTPATPGGTVKTARAGAKVNLRAEPSTASPVLGTLTDGDAVTVYGETADGWYDVNAGGTRGYIKNSLVTLGNAVSTPSSPAGESAGAAQGGERRETLTAKIDGSTVTFELTQTDRREDDGIFSVDIRVLKNGVQVQKIAFETEGVSSALQQMMYLNDVNMDGYADLSLVRITGASDAFGTHYLYDPQTGLFVCRQELDRLSLFRCSLYPAGKYVLNYLHDGAATGRWELYQWQNGQLVLLAEASRSYDDRFFYDEVIRYDLGGKQTVYEEAWEYRYDAYEESNREWQTRCEILLQVLWNGVEPGAENPWMTGFMG